MGYNTIKYKFLGPNIGVRRHGSCIVDITVEGHCSAILLFTGQDEAPLDRVPVVSGPPIGLDVAERVFASTSVVDRNGAPLPPDTPVTITYRW